MKIHGVRWSRLAGLALGISGCNAIAGINAGTPREDGAGGSQTNCTPGEVSSCYEGPAATKDIGSCKSGMRTCDAEGTAFDACSAQVLPATGDDCSAYKDQDCDGKLTCPCTPNEMKSCYDGIPATTEGVGVCRAGMRTCNAEGTGFGDCVDEVKPILEDCATQKDENCDGTVNEATSGCVCDPAMKLPVPCDAMQPGECGKGTKLCAADGKSYGACTPKPATFENCFTTEDEDCDGMPAVGCVGTTLLGGVTWTSSGDDGVFGIASDAMGNIFLGGVSGSSQGANYAVTSGSGEITKLGAQGWKKSYPATGSGSYSVVRGVTVDGTGNVLLIGEYQGTINSNGVSLTSAENVSSDVFVIKLAPDGTLKWSKSYGGPGYQYGVGISAAANGDVFLGGTMSGVMSFGSTTLTSIGSTDVFVARLDGATGSAKWGKSFGSADVQNAWDVAATPEGNVVVTGQFNGSINFGGGNLGNGGDKDIFLAKLDGNDGSQVWAKRFGESDDQIGYAVAADSMGNIALTGSVQGKTDFGGGPFDAGAANPSDLFITSFDADGKHRWSKLFGNSNAPQVGRDVAVDAGGNVVITGYFNGTLQFGATILTTPSAGGGVLNVFVAKLKGADGAPGWARGFSDVGEQVGRSIATDPLGNVIFGGSLAGTINFGPPAGSFTSVFGHDAFWAKLAP